jgi:diketogulonate reductase-like aldo/keto reductase
MLNFVIHGSDISLKSDRWGEVRCARQGVYGWQVTAPIIGPRTLEQLKGSVNALDVQLSEETLAKLDEIWPGPGNQAPEAYAW